VPFFVILSVVMGFVIITIDPPRILFTIALVFSFSAPLRWIWTRFRGSGKAGDSDTPVERH
jgi:CDP-diacylglycerol--serine O-phosphatidyltransferase